MKELYSIGETAKLMGISIQTLRNYSNLKLLKPEYVDPDTGYRYYSFRQFHYIDRIKYLRGLGLPLCEIEDILEDGKTDKMLNYLKIQEKRIASELKKIKEVHEDIKWYINYFEYLDHYHFENIPYVLRLDKRYIMYVDCNEGDTVETVETRLAQLKNKQNLKYRRQYGYIADFDSMINKNFKPNRYFIYLKEKPESDADWLMELPQGEYLCFRAKVCAGEYDPSIIMKYLENTSLPQYVVASEYEDNLVEYHYCPYEIQILISPNS